MGGVVNPPAALASTTGTVWRQGQPVEASQGWRGPPMVINVTTPDASSFKASESQIIRTYARALERARKRHG
jgi:hypothetical protein